MIDNEIRIRKIFNNLLNAYIYDMEKNKSELASHVIFAYNFASKTLIFDQKYVLLVK